VKVPAWLNDATMYHNRGDSTFSGENSEYGDFFGLDDLWTERPEVVRGLTKVYGDWIASTDVDGFRLDTVKHANLDFWPQFSQGIEKAAEKAGKKDFFMFGEVCADQISRRCAAAACPPPDLAAAAAVAPAVGGSADTHAATTFTLREHRRQPADPFLGNHDMGRIGSFIGGGTSRPAALRPAAHQLMLLTCGQPVTSGDDMSPARAVGLGRLAGHVRQ
jgi:glycosidase